MPNLLIITTNFPPSSSAGTQRILRICKYLNKSRWKIHVLTLKEKYYSQKLGNISCLSEVSVTRTDKIDILSFLIGIKSLFKKNTGNFEKKESKPFQIESNKSVIHKFFKSLRSLVNTPLKVVSDLLEFPDREITWVPIAVIRGLGIIRKNEIDVIFSSSPRHSNHLTAAILKILTGKKMVIDFRDPWSRSPWHDAQRNFSSFEKLKLTGTKYLEKWVVRKADKVILVTNEMRDDFVHHYSNEISQTKFSLFLNGFDPGNIPDGVINHKLKRNKTVIFSHIGALYKLRDPFPLFVCIEKMKEEKLIDPESVQFQFIGAITPDLSHIHAYVSKFNLEALVKFIPSVSYNESLEYMNSSDVLIILQPGTKLQVPAKFYDYLCFTKPIFGIGESNSAIQNLISDKYGCFADYNNINDIQAKIMHLLQNRESYEQKIPANRAEFDISKNMVRLETMLNPFQ